MRPKLRQRAAFAEIWRNIPATINVVAICDGMTALAAAGATNNGAFTAVKLKAQSNGCLDTDLEKRRVRIRKTARDSEITKSAASRFVDAASQSNSGCAISVAISCTNRGIILLAK